MKSSTQANDHCCHPQKPKGKSFDYILWPSAVIIVFGYLVGFAKVETFPLQVNNYGIAVVDLMNKMWWGLLLAILVVGVLNRVPREVVMSIMGSRRGVGGILRATLAGVLLDLCSHGILVVGMKLYERGASLGQTMAFLVASPWNSFSMTLILIALIGWSKTLVFIILSCVIAIISGLVFEKLVLAGRLPDNPNSVDLPQDMNVFSEIKKLIRNSSWGLSSWSTILFEGFVGSKMILRWIFFGVVLAALLRVLMTPETFQTFFGPSLMGLGLTILAATIIEVCSEGSAPIAADLVTIAKAPGNGFTFLMAGVATDYTEILSIKETTNSWKIAFFLPLVTVPQVVILGYLLNLWGS